MTTIFVVLSTLLGLFLPGSETPDRCEIPTPTTAKGFSQMFSELDPAEFGAADVGVSVPLSDGRSVWLFGDTMSWTRFVHSTAVTQDGGCLHVSNKGDQLLPDSGKKWYWLEAGKEISPGVLEVTAEETEKHGEGVWGFRHTGYNRTALVTVDGAGNVTFQKWTSRYRANQAASLNDLTVKKNGQVTYSPRLHPEFELASGKTLKTVAQNWSDSEHHPLETYRIKFSEVG